MITTWLLFCADAHTNEVVSTALNGLQATDSFKEYLCADGKKRYLYGVPDYSFAARIWRSQKQLNVSVLIFRSQNNGKPDAWKFPEKRKLTLPAIILKSNQLKKKMATSKPRKQS